MFDKLICWLIDRYADVYVLFNPITPLDTAALGEGVCAVKTGQVNFYLYTREGRTVCIDAGLGRRIARRELARLGANPEQVSHLFLTHSDFDHVGGAEVFGAARVYLSRQEEPMIDGSVARKFGLLRNRLRVPGYELLDDGEVVTAGPITVRAILTPGHTPGSTSYLVDDKFLFTGDAFRVLDGRARPNRKIITMSAADSERSMRKLAGIPNVRRLFTAHRGCADDFDAVMAEYKPGQGQSPQ